VRAVFYERDRYVHPASETSIAGLRRRSRSYRSIRRLPAAVRPAQARTIPALHDLGFAGGGGTARPRGLFWAGCFMLE